jgi:hypothetical protein
VDFENSIKQQRDIYSEKIIELSDILKEITDSEEFKTNKGGSLFFF